MYSAYPRLVEDTCSTSDGVNLEILRSKDLHAGIPFVIVPGMLGTAPMFAERIEMMNPRPGIAFSHRGCGKSGSPAEGHYDFASRCLDLQAVVDHYQLTEYFVYGFSRGVAMAVQHTLENQGRVKGLILDDAEPIYPRLTRGWLKRIMEANFLWAHPFALERIQKESIEHDLYGQLDQIKVPTLIFRGLMEGSLLNQPASEEMLARLPQSELVILPNSAHGASPADFPQFRDATIAFFNRLNPLLEDQPA